MSRLILSVGLTFLRGRTEYGDSVEDEWVVVWLLRDLTKNFDDLWVKIGDNDGEFLLIEAAGSLPTWLESEVAENRVRRGLVGRMHLLANVSIRSGFIEAVYISSNQSTKRKTQNRENR